MITPYLRTYQTSSGASPYLDAIPYESFIFAGGEPHIRIKRNIPSHYPVIIDARLTNPGEFLTLIALTDALRRAGAEKIGLFCPYFPGARQDRVERGSGNAFTAKVYANIINAQGYYKVVVCDPHSDVTPALIENVEVYPADSLYNEIKFKPILWNTTLIAPDAGSRKKVEKIAKIHNLPFLQASKTRNINNGGLTDTTIDAPSASGRFVVIDDICDGGATFIALAEAFRQSEAGAKSALDLVVTHGIFSKGLNELKKHYSTIFTTDSFDTVFQFKDEIDRGYLKVLPIVELAYGKQGLNGY